MSSAFDAKSLRDVLDLARALDMFDGARPHPGVDQDLHKRVRAALVGDLNAAMGAFLAEITPAPPAPPPAPAPEPAQDAPDAAPDVQTDPPPPPAEGDAPAGS